MNGETADLVRGNNAFALDLYALLARSPGNLVFSPLNIWSVLAMLAMGARGKTASELLATLRVSLTSPQLSAAAGLLLGQLLRPGPMDLLVLNRLWLQDGFAVLPSFEERVAQLAGASIEHLDFKADAGTAGRRINAWIAEATQRKINTLLDPDQLDERTRLVLTGAMYFKARWSSQFKSRDTRSMDFHSGAETTTAPGMHLREELFYTEDALARSLELLYAGGRLGFLLVLPQARDGLPACEQALCRNPEGLPTLVERLRPEDVALTLPRFTCESHLGLVPSLKALGMVSAYEPARADFSGLVGSGKGLCLGDVVQGARIEVDEEGTKAAAATAVSIRLGARSGQPRVQVCADHPFLFLIRDRKTQSVLFVGRVMRP